MIAPQNQAVGGGVAVTVINQQPMNSMPAAHQRQYIPPMEPHRDWSSGICSCYEDCSSCLLECCCKACYDCFIFAEAGEFCCLPYCCPGAMHMALRSKYRGKHGIAGSMCEDYYCTCCCCTHMCMMCQIKRDMDYVKHMGFRP